MEKEGTKERKRVGKIIVNEEMIYTWWVCANLRRKEYLSLCALWFPIILGHWFESMIIPHSSHNLSFTIHLSLSLSLTVTVLNWKLAFESIRSAVVTTDPIHHQPWCSFQGKNSSEQDLATALKEQETRSLGASRKTPNSQWLVVKVLEWGTETISYDNWGWDRRDFVRCKKSTQNSSSWKRAHLESLEKDRIAEETVAMVTCGWVQG